jgi:alkylation response protein AidB-like acyl-CoA dehydrogenase
VASSVDPVQLTGGGFLLLNAAPDEIFTREDLSPAQQMFGRVAEDFVRTEVVPRLQQIWAKDTEITLELMRKAGDLDLLRVDIPEAYGGLGLDKVSSAYVREKIGVVPSFSAPFGAHTTIGILPIAYFGTEAQKARYLPDLSSGKKMAAYALTEPGSGSDALSARTKATLSQDGKHYILNGQKMWITNGGFADVFIIFAQVDGNRFTAFIVERNMGVVAGRDEPKLGLDGSSTTAIILDNVHVPVENVLGEIGQGHKVALNILNIGRLGLGTINLGASKQSLNGALEYAVQRQQFDQAIATFGMIKHKLGEMATRCYVGDAMVYRTLGNVDRALKSVAGEDSSGVLKAIEQFSAECCIIKVWVTETLAYVVDEALQIHGGYGYSREYPAERAYRDARINRIWEGTNEINRLLIPTRLLKNPAISRFVGSDLTALLYSRECIPTAGELFGSEYDLLLSSKQLIALMLGFAKTVFGDELAKQQELMARIADSIIETYAVESSLLRTRKLVGTRGEANCTIPIHMTRVYASDAADRIQHSAKQVVAALRDKADTAPLQEILRKISLHPAFNTIAARRRIADSLIQAGRYAF